MLKPSSKKRKPVVVLDTNVWISAMIWGGEPAEIILAVEKGQIRVVVSEEIVEEISRTLDYHRLREVYESVNVNRQQLVETVLLIGKLVQVGSKVEVVEADPSDNKILDCALTSKADFIVSGDKHLLRLKKFRNTQILTVAEFAKLLKALD